MQKMRGPTNPRYDESIDCFQLSHLITRSVCIRNGTKDQFEFNPDWMDTPSYRLIRNNDRMIKLIEIHEDTEPEPNTERFEGTLEGVAITAALNWDAIRQRIALFLCRQTSMQTRDQLRLGTDV